APDRDFTVDVDAMLARVTAKTKIVFLANPNNPTGTYLPFSEVRRLHAGLPEHVLFVIDAAYAEYVRRNDYDSGVSLVSEFDNVLMTRTFSKIHGLAALRIGWAYCPAGIAETLNRIRGPFNMSSPAIAAGAAAMGDIAHMEAAKAHNDSWLASVSRELEGLGLAVTPSVANFVLMHFPEGGNRTASGADDYLKSKGVIVRKVSAYGFPNALRMTIGSEDDNTRALAALTEYMSGASA
ncbi:MAG: histidinol-phosphate transaminase, partial [Hyphomicrobium sp.]